MAANGARLIPIDGLNLDVAPQYLKPTQARYIKNLYYQISDNGTAGSEKGSQSGVSKPLPSNEIYCPLELPEGDNHVIGACPSTDTKELYVFVYNSKDNHSIFRIDGLLTKCEMVKVDPCFDFVLDPKYFIGEGQCHLEVIYVINPDTKEQVVKKDLYWTTGRGAQGYLRTDDSVDTNGFDAELFPYFAGEYDKCAMVRMGVPTPNGCIEVEDVPYSIEDADKNNPQRYNSFQWRISVTDVFGRPSEHGMISDLYYGSNGCTNEIARCVNLTFPTTSPFDDKIQIEYRNCNSNQWSLDTVIELYEGSALGKWWERTRNPKVNYQDGKITYKFCKDKLCETIPTDETDRTAPEQPRVSQAVTKIGKSIALSNNMDGFRPMVKKELDKVSIEVTKPVSNTIGQSANIEIYIRIYNPFRKTYQQVYKKGKDYVFGGVVSSSANKSVDNIKSDYQQYFAVSGQKGYLGYLAGTDNYTAGVQYYLEDGVFIKDTDFVVNTKREYFMKFEFTGVPRKQYLFRLASHLANPNVEDIRKTSTYVAGVYNYSSQSVGAKRNDNKELVIDTCDGNYSTVDTGEMLITYDLTNPLGGAGDRSKSNSSVLDGYVFESQDVDTKEFKTPIELLEVVPSVNSAYKSGTTDHNGFYFAAHDGYFFDLGFRGYCSCVKKILCTTYYSNNRYRRYPKNLVIGNAKGESFKSYCPDYEVYPCSRVLIKGRVQLCDTGESVAGAVVVLARGGEGITDAEGNFTIVAHDDVLNSVRRDKIYLMSGGCAFTSCSGGCVEAKDIIITPCTSCSERVVQAGEFEVFITNNRGLLSGGRYIAEITAYDWLGRHGFAQTGDNFAFSIPSLNETKSFGFSNVAINIPQDVTFDDWVEYVTIGISDELNYAGQFITWIADKVTFVDNSGKENITAPTQIRIDYNSLNEFNTKNNFNTTTGWTVTPEKEDQPRIADVIEFIRNGDGEFFDKKITALVKYDQQGQYILIDYNDALKGLKENALIRIANPADCVNKDLFHELCGKYKVINGKIQQNKIPLNAFDTYYQYRQIPVPVPTETVVEGEPETIIELRQFGFPFEHHSITDSWGYKCANKGRVNVRNPYENELLHLDEIAMSGAIAVNAQLNYLNYFDDKNKINFNINGTGGIVSVKIKTGMAFILCQYKNFVVGYGDNVARLNAQNIVSVPSGDGTFGNPEREVTGNYGCQLFDKSTIREKEGLTHWLDRNMVAILQNNFQQTIDVARYNDARSTIVSWLLPKIKFQQKYNIENGNTRYFHAVIHPANNEYLLSENTIGSNDFVNTEREENVSKHETIAFDIFAKVWKSFYAFTPEYFSFLEGANEGQLLFSFEKGVARSHTALNNKSWNVFSGIPTESVYRFIFSTDGFKKKKFQSMSVYCPEKNYWADLVITENKQVSRILKKWWKKALYFWSAPFLMDTTKAKGKDILEGDNLEGSWIDVRLIGDPDGKYSELYGVTVFAKGQEQTGA